MRQKEDENGREQERESNAQHATQTCNEAFLASMIVVSQSASDIVRRGEVYICKNLSTPLWSAMSWIAKMRWQTYWSKVNSLWASFSKSFIFCIRKPRSAAAKHWCICSVILQVDRAQFKHSSSTVCIQLLGSCEVTLWRVALSALQLHPHCQLIKRNSQQSLEAAERALRCLDIRC